MRKQTVLEKTAGQVRNGIQDEYEDLYILTVEEVFQAACAAVRKEQSEELLIKFYLELFEQKEMLPESDENIRRYVREMVFHLAGSAPESEEEGIPKGEQIGESQAAELWLQIEKRLGWSGEDGDGVFDDEDTSSSGLEAYVKGFIRVVFTVALVGGILIFLCRNVIGVISARKAEQTAAQMQQDDGWEDVYSESREKDKEEEQEELLRSAFFEQKDGRLFLMTADGPLRREKICHGKQILSFAEDGALEKIEKNSQADSQNPSAFNGEDQYFIKNGNIYIQEGRSGRENCVVGNGHIVWMDCRCQSLWYVCSYQIPNSDQIKMTAFRSELDGDSEEELITDSLLLKKEGLQFSKDWIYYKSGNSVFRKSMDGLRKEKMAETDGEYFAFGDTLFYMDGDDVRSVSKGESDYQENGEFQVSIEDGAIIFTDEDGEPAVPDENGEIRFGDRIYSMYGNRVANVRQADIVHEGTVYYLDDPDGQRKIYRNSQDDSFTGLMPQNGIRTDSLCLSGSWLYYSACMEQIDGVQYSQIYRVNLENMAQEKVGRLFQGVVTAMYASSHENRIYGEYIDSVKNGEIHGSICAITENRELGIIEDSVPRSQGNDRLQFAVSGGDKIYCFYHTCTYDSESGVIRDISTQAVEIEW